MPKVPVQFDVKVSGHMPLFEEPYWDSKCGKYRISKMDCTRPWRLFRRLPTSFKKGWGWIGVGIGFNSRTEAVAAAWDDVKTRKASKRCHTRGNG
jgi:hypothetical protein